MRIPGIPAVLAAIALLPGGLAAQVQSALQDSVGPFLDRVEASIAARDVNQVMATYADSGVVSAGFGDLQTDLHQVASGMASFFGNLDACQIRFQRPYLAPLGAGAIAVTARYTFHVIPHGEPGHSSRGVWSAVLVVRHGHTVILQEHQSQAPGLVPDDPAARGT